MSVILALDLGTKTGWACSNGGAGVANFERHAGHGHLGFRFCGWLGDLLVETGAAVVVIETPPVYMRQAKAVQVLQGLRMLACATCYGHDRRLVDEVAVASWQAWARKHRPTWVKGDLADAQALLAYFVAVRLPLLEEAA